MTEPMREQMELELENLEKERKKLQEFQNKMSGITGTGRSANRMISATVNQQGRLTELVFEGNRYRTLAPKELASFVLEAVHAAEDDAAAQAIAATGKLLPAGFLELLGLGEDGSAGKVDTTAVFDAAYRMTDMSMFGTGRKER